MGSRIDSAPGAGTPAEAEREEVDTVAGPYTLRDLVVMVSAAVVLIGSLLPFAFMQALTTAWLQAGWQFNQFVYFLLPLSIGVAFGWRRLAGRTQVRVASLSLDQLGSAAAVLSAAYFFFAGINFMSPTYVLCLLGALGMVGGTTAAPYIGAFAADFAPGEGPLLARPVRPAPRRSRAAAAGAAEAAGAGPAAGEPAAGESGAAGPAAAAPADESHHPEAGWPVDVGPGGHRSEDLEGRGDRRGGDRRGAAPALAHAGVVAGPADARTADAGRERARSGAPSPAAGREAEGDAVRAAVESPSYHAGDVAPVPSEAFWFAVPAPRDAMDPETRRPLFAVQPGEWNLALAERGDHLMVQHTDGRIGLLFDLEAIQRA